LYINKQIYAYRYINAINITMPKNDIIQILKSKLTKL